MNAERPERPAALARDSALVAAANALVAIAARPSIPRSRSGRRPRELSKASAVAAYAEALRAGATEPTPEGKLAAIDRAIDAVTHAAGAGSDPDLVEIEELLGLCRARWAE